MTRGWAMTHNSLLCTLLNSGKRRHFKDAKCLCRSIYNVSTGVCRALSVGKTVFILVSAK